MLKIDFDKVESIIQEVADTEILPRFCSLKKEEISYKAGDDPVTIADRRAENALSKRLSDLLQGSKVVAEEAYASDMRIFDHFHDESPVWIIDPIDGTRNFIAGRDTFGIIVALSQQNQTLASWLYHPTSREFISAEKGGGAYYQGQKLKVRSAESLDKMLGVLGYQIYQAYQNSAHATDDSFQKPRFAEPSKAACHDFPRLVLDKPHFGCDDAQQWHFRALLQTCSPWDDAAPLMIHSESGGYSAHWNGEPFRPNSYGHGFMATPDKDSWMEMKNWVRSIVEIPE